MTRKRRSLQSKKAEGRPTRQGPEKRAKIDDERAEAKQAHQQVDSVSSNSEDDLLTMKLVHSIKVRNTENLS